MKRFRRVGVTGAVIGLLAGFATTVLPTTAGATPTPPSTSSCTYTDGASTGTSAITVHPGDTVGISCTGLPASTGLAIAEASPLGGLVPAANASNEADVAAANLSSSSDASGNLTASFAIPATFGASDPNAQCPPTQDQVNKGLTACVIAIASISPQVPLNTVFLNYVGQPTPVLPTISLNFSVGLAGETITPTVTSGYFWGAAIAGAPDVSGVPAPTVLVGSTPATTSSVAIAAPTYSGGVLTGPVLSGSFVLPSGSGNSPVSIIEANVTSAAGNGPPQPSPLSGNALMATTPFAYTGTPSINVAPSSGCLGVSVAVNGSNFDPQGGTASVAFSQGLPTADAVSGIAVHPDGTFSTTLPVGQNELNYLASLSGPPSQVSDSIDAAQTESTAAGGLILTASGSFSVLGTSAGPCPTVGGAGNTCKVNQVIQETVTGVTSGLIISEGNGPTPCTVSGATNNADGIHLALQGVTLNGRVQTASGCLNTVQVEDARGTLVGWTTTGQLETDFLGPNIGSNTWDHVIPAQNLTWSPVRSLTYPGDPSGVLSEVAAGATGPLPTSSQSAGLNGAAGPYPAMNESSTPVDLCSAAPGGGGGTFNCDAGLALVVPAFVAAGPYQATLDLVIT